MNPTAIYSKSGKGVQEASGKTSLLSRPDRAVLSAIDGRATLNDVAVKVGKTFDGTFEKLIGELDKGGFIREVSPGVAAPQSKGGAKPAAKGGGAPAASMDPGSDLDFTAIPTTPSKSKSAVPPPQAPPRPAAPAPKPMNIPPPPPPPSAAEKAKAEQANKSQQDAMAKAREEAERKAAADRDKAKAEAEAKIRAETEGKLRAEAEAKARAAAEAKVAAEAEAKVKAARDAAVRAAAEAKAKAEAETKRAREEADRVRREAEEKAERIRKEAEERIRREQEEMKRKLEEERRAREEAERKAKEEARRLEEERRKLEEERKRREEEHKREEAERAARRKREEEEEAARRAERRKREEEEEAERTDRRRRDQEEEERGRAEREAERAERKRREEEEEAREAAEREARRKSKKADEEIALPDLEEEKPKPKAKAKEKEKAPEPAKAKGGGGFADSLMADLDSFTTREENDQKEREEEERKRKEEAARRAREAEERRQKEEAERLEREEKARRKKEEEEQRRRDEADLRGREEKEKQRLKDEEEKRKKETEEREKKAKQDERLEVKATRGVDAFAAEAELKARRERLLAKAPTAAARAADREKGGLGKPIALGLFLLLLVAFGAAHVVPIDVAPYQTAATDAFGKPVKIGSANLSLYSGLMVKFHDVAVGEVKIGEVRAVPEFSALTGAKKEFSRVEIDGLRLEQAEVGEAFFASIKAENFRVAKVLIHKLELAGPLALPKGLDVELAYDAEGAPRAAVVRGPEALLLRLTAKGKSVDFELDSSSFTLPFAKDVSLAKFKAKGSATPQAAAVDEWDGEILGGRISGNANIRWGETWNIDGVITARSITAAVFAPALLSEGKAEASGKFGMRGDPASLAESARIDGSFTVSRGVLGSIDLSRAIQTGGKQATGRTQFNELNGQGVYDRGAITLRSVTLTAGQLNAGASVDISQGGALSGRIVADVKVSSQTLRATLNLGGTLKEPQVRN